MGYEQIGLEAVFEDSNFKNGVRNYLDSIGTMESASSRVVQGISNEYSKIGGVISKAAAGIAAAAAGMVTAAVASVATVGIDFNAMSEQAEIAFSTMLGSGEDAKSFLDDLKKFAATTPFEFEDLTSASQKLLAMGFNAEEVLPLMESIGDSVSGLGGGKAEIDSVVRALGQMRAKGKVQAEEMMQLTEIGIPAWELLAQTLDTDVATAMDMVTKRQVDAATAIPGLISGMNSKFGGLMKEQSRSWNGLLSTISDTFSITSGTVVEPFFELMREGLAGIVDFTSSPEFTDGVAKLTEVVRNAAAAMSDWSARVLPPLLEQVGAFANWLLEVASGGGVMNEHFAEMNPTLQTWIERGVAVYETLQMIRDRIVEFMDRVRELVQPLTDWIAQHVTLKDVLIAAAGAVAAFVAPLVLATAQMAAVGTAATVAVALIREAWENNLGGVRDFAAQTWEQIKGIFATATEIIRTVFEQDGETMKSTASRIWDGIKGVVEGTLNAIQGVLNTILAAVKGDWETVWNNIKSAATTIWDGISTAWNDALQGLTDYLQDHLPTWKEKLGEWGNAAWQWITDVAPTVTEKLGEWVGSIIRWLGENLPKFVATILEWGTALYTWIGDVIPNAIDALTDFIHSLRTEGSTEGTTQFGELASEWTEKLWRWIRDDLIPAVGPAFRDFITAVGTYGLELTQALGDLAKELGLLLWEWIVDVTPVAVQKLGDWGQDLWEWLSDNLPKWTEKLGDWAEAAWKWITDTAIPEATEKLGDWGEDLWTWLADNLPKWVEKLSDWAEAAWKWITDTAIPKATEKLGDWGEAVWTWLGDNLPEWKKKLGEWAEAAWQWIVDAAGKVGEKLDGWWGEIKTWLSDNLTTMTTAFWQLGVDIVDGIINGINSKIQEAKTAIANLLNLQSQTADQTTESHSPSELYKRKGANMAEGLILGMQSLAARVAQTAADLANRATQSLDAALDAHSPSRVWYASGEAAGDGFIRGMASKLSEAVRVAADFAARATNALSSGVGTMAGSAGATAGGIASRAMQAAEAQMDAIRSYADVVGRSTGGDVAEIARMWRNMAMDTTAMIDKGLQENLSGALDEKGALAWVHRIAEFEGRLRELGTTLSGATGVAAPEATLGRIFGDALTAMRSSSVQSYANSYATTNNFGPVYVNTPMDMAEFEFRIQRVLADSF